MVFEQDRRALASLSGWDWLSLSVQQAQELVEACGGDATGEYRSSHYHVNIPGVHQSVSFSIYHDMYPDFASFWVTDYGAHYTIVDFPVVGWTLTYRREQGVDDVLLEPPASSRTLVSYVFTRLQWDVLPRSLYPQVCEWLSSKMNPEEIVQVVNAAAL